MSTNCEISVDRIHLHVPVGRVELGPGVLGHERPVDGEHGELLEPLQQVELVFGLIDLSHVK